MHITASSLASSALNSALVIALLTPLLMDQKSNRLPSRFAYNVDATAPSAETRMVKALQQHGNTTYVLVKDDERVVDATIGINIIPSTPVLAAN